MYRCPPGCTCGKHQPPSDDKRRAIGEAVRAAAQRRRERRGIIPPLTGSIGLMPLPDDFGAPVHRQCRHCGRLLAPVNGRLPRHRKPPPGRYAGATVPLTGLDAGWCGE